MTRFSEGAPYVQIQVLAIRPGRCATSVLTIHCSLFTVHQSLSAIHYPLSVLLLLRLLQSFVKTLHSDGTPAQVAAGFALGASLGLTPVFTVHNAIVIAALCRSSPFITPSL